MAEILTLFTSLLHNLALIFSLVFVYTLIAPYVRQTRPGFRGVATGALFAVIALVGMVFPIQVAPGVIVDGRIVIVALAGVFDGGVSAVIAASLVSVYRLWLGGVGAIAGVGAVLTAMALGAWVHWRWGARVREFGARQFLLLGGALAGSGLLWTLALPDADLAWRMLKVLALPVSVLYPFLAVLAGTLLSYMSREHERVTVQEFSIEHSPEAVLWVASIGQLVNVNVAAVQLCGYSREEFLSMHFWDLDVNCSSESWPAALAKALEHTNVLFESTFRARDGKLIPVEISATFLEFEGIEYVCAFLRDTTERRKAEAVIRESEGRYRMIVETTNEVIYRVTTTANDPFGGSVQFVSSQVRNILGYQPDEFVRDPGLWFGIVHPDDRPALAESTQKIFASGKAWTRQFRLRHKETAEYRWMEDTVVPETDDHGNVIAIQGAARDITERKRLEEKVEAIQRHVIQTERLKALGELAGGVAHTFNNVLAIILGRVELLLAQTRSPNVQRQLGVIQKTAKDAARTVRRIQEFARARPSRPFQAVDVNQVVDEVVELTRPRWKEEAEANGISYHVSTEKAPLPPVAGDPSELREALTSFVFNALDAMPGGGRVIFRTGIEGERVYCAVTDTGIGMAEDVRRRVFDPFFTTKGERGSGLGLSVVQAIITRHGGEIDVRSQVG